MHKKCFPVGILPGPRCTWIKGILLLRGRGRTGGVGRRGMGKTVGWKDGRTGKGRSLLLRGGREEREEGRTGRGNRVG